MEPLKECTEFDFQLKQIQINGLTWLPWIGKEYSKGDALILGESHYCYGNFTPEDIEHNRDETRIVIDYFVKSGRDAGNQYKTYEPMETIIGNTITHNDCEKIWHQIAYMNLIQKCMTSNDKRPHWQQFLDGWLVVLQVVNVLRPGICICFSSDKKLNRANFNRLEEFKDNVSFNYSILPNADTDSKISNCIVSTPGKITIDNYNCRVIFIQHASRIKGNGFQAWQGVIKKYLEEN